MGYDKNNIAAAFSTVARLVRQDQPVVLSKVEGLNSVSCTIFKETVTHSFNEKDHGFNLQRIFSIDKEGKWHRCVRTNNSNPTDETLIDLICQAMSYVAKAKKETTKPTKSIKVITLSEEEIDKEIERLTTIKKEMQLKREKKAKLQAILDFGEISLDELTNLIKECAE